MFKKILLGLDGSPESTRALDLATKIAADDSAHIESCTCASTCSPAARACRPPAPTRTISRRSSASRPTRWWPVGRTSPSPSSPAPRAGPAHVLADQAGDRGADVIIVGTRGHTGLAGLLLGSVTQRLLHISPCPVMAVPAPIGARHGAETSETAATAAV